MNKILALLFTAFLIFPMSAFAADNVNTGFFGNTAIKGYDPVAYFTQGKPVKGDSEFTYEWNGAKWKFSSAEHKKLFSDAPEKYAPQYGGWCAFAMAMGDKAGIDPTAWHINDEKLYLNYSDSVNKDWLSDRDNFIEKADIEWQKVKK